MTHKIVWTWSRGSVEAEAVCDDDECLNAYECDYPCETYPDLRRDDAGVVSHGGYDDTAATPRHIMHKAGECNLELFLNAERGLLVELNEDDHPDFVIAETVIDPVWMGEDGALWRVSIAAEVEEVTGTPHGCFGGGGFMVTRTDCECSIGHDHTLSDEPYSGLFGTVPPVPTSPVSDTSRSEQQNG